MSFFNSLQEYVSNSVANLSLGSKKFSLNRSETTESSSSQPTTGQSSSLHGFPKVLPTPGASPIPQIRRKSIFDNRTLSPSPSLRRPNSFRQPAQTQSQPQIQTIPHSSSIQTRSPAATIAGRRNYNFCQRRPSWAEIENSNTTEIQEVDNAYFESFTALTWKHENQRQSAIKNVETRARQMTYNEIDLGITPIDYTLPANELDSLYLEMLYTITNSVGAPAPGGQYAHFKDDLFTYGQKAFRMPSDKHFSLLQMTGEEKPPIIVLSVSVIEAENLEAKDANGFSDPYCMLGILPKEDVPQQFSDNGSNAATAAAANTTLNNQQIYGTGEVPFGQRKHHSSFRLSFKRKDVRNRDHRDSVTNLLPAKYIRATSVKPNTLNPKWNEKFRFDISDLTSESLHLDIWDHDDESSVFEAVSKLNEVRGVRGLGRYFKQICQSARQNSQDDFLGCVTIPLSDIPSTGLESWFRLVARSNRSTVQGRIRLKLWLSTREDRCTSDEDNWGEMLQHEKLCMIFIDYELSIFGNESYAWNGELSGEALTILHQHAVQSDLTELQRMMCLWMAVSKVCLKHPLNFRWILKLLSDLERLWPTLNLSRDDENWMANSFTSVLERWFIFIKYHRQLFPALYNQSLHRLEFLLKCLSFLSNMKAFWKCCPFNREIRGEIITAVRKGTIDWYTQIRSLTINTQTTVNNFDNKENAAFFFTELCMELESNFNYYHQLFEEINRIPYFTVVFKQIDLLLVDEIDKLLKNEISPDTKTYQAIFLLYFAIRDILSLSHGSSEQKLQLSHCIEWLTPFLNCWLNTCKTILLNRVERALIVNKEVINDKNVMYSTSAVDIVTTLCHLRDFWRLLQWPKSQSIGLIGQLLDCICSASILYGNKIYQKLLETGYFEIKLITFQLSNEMCITVNNLEYVRNFLSHCYKYFDLNAFNLMAQQSNVSVSGQLAATIEELQYFISSILKQVPVQIQNSLKKQIFHLAWSPECLPADQAIEPLFDYLYTHLNSFNMALLGTNFQKVLFEIWEITLNELNEQLDASEKNDEKLISFYDRLYTALDLLLDFFEADGQGLADEILRTKTFLDLEKRLHYFRMNTEDLIDVFYNQRLQEQLTTTSTNFGLLAVLYAKDVIPLDPNGYSDPFVIIELLPKHVFTNCNEQQTNVHKRTLNPVFDECFEFSVTWEQCRTANAMIAFTVMDYDVITANDFAGEAFLSLANISGVSDASTGIDNFHGLKIVELPLMQFQDKNNQILKILESRVNDKQAAEFIKKQKMKCSA